MKKQSTYLGVDIGATKTLFLVVRFSARGFEILESARCETPHDEKRILSVVEDSYRGFGEEYKISAVGIGFGGPVDHERGAALFGPNLKTKKIEFKKTLEKRLRVKVAIDNDAKCFVLAESAFGLAKGFKNIIGVTVGTGIGGAIMIDGKLYRGVNNLAGEFGHTLLRGEEFEIEGSGTGLSRIYERLTGKKSDGFHIVNLAKTGDIKAKEAIDIVSNNLGVLLTNIIDTFNPEIVVLGGGMSKVGMFVNKAKGYARKKIFAPMIAKTPILVSKLSQTGVALGAAYAASGMAHK